MTFFKVAHHGSLNATPRSVVASMPAKAFAAMIPTSSRPFKSIPLVSLLDALQDRATACIRSDDVTQNLAGNFQRGEFWIDCLLPVDVV